MYDIHCHILPMFDDGSESIDESCAMAELAFQSKVKGIVATPHCNGEDLMDADRFRAMCDMHTTLRTKLAERDIPIELYLGMEVLLDDSIYEPLEHDALLTLNRSNYLLVEFPFDDNPDHVRALLKAVCLRGYRPVIAHPERYDFVQSDPEMVFEFLDREYVLQVNRGSIMGRFGDNAKRCARWLLDGQLAHVVASDGHSATHRTPYVFDCYQYILSKYSVEYAEVLFHENPQRIIGNRPILPNC